MNWNYAYTPHIWPSLLAILLMLGMAVYSERHRSIPGALPFMVGCLLGAAWAAGSVMEYASTDLASKLFWGKFQGAWQLPSVTAVACFVMEYAWPGRWLTRRNLALLSVAPILVFGLIVSGDSLHLIWRSFNIRDEIVIPELGLGGWAAVAYSFLLVILNIVIFIWLFIRSPQHRWPVAIMIVGHVGVRIFFMLENLKYIQSDLPLDIIGLVFITVMYSIALYGFRLFDPIPLARQTAIQQLRDGILVLDPQARVVALNPAAERILGKPLKHVRGQNLIDLFPNFPKLTLPLSVTTTIPKPIEVQAGPTTNNHSFELNFSPLNDFRGLPVGYLLLLHDVTEQRRTQAQILEQQRALATLNERDRLARELHDELSQELAYINVQAQTIDDMLGAGKVEQASAQLKFLGQLTRQTQVDVRGQIMKLSMETHPGDGFIGALRHFLTTFEAMYGIPGELKVSGDPTGICLEPTAEVQLMRIVQEAFTNVRKHAGAKNIQVSLERNSQQITLAIQDDGSGFTPNESSSGNRTFGMRIMKERAAEIGGTLELQSIPGHGTRVSIKVPAKGEL